MTKGVARAFEVNVPRMASTLLEIMMRFWIAKYCKTPDGALLLLELQRYVDEILSSSEDKEKLWSSYLAMNNVLLKNGFKVKQVFSSHSWHLPFDQNGRGEGQ